MKTFDELFAELSDKVAAGDPASGTVAALATALTLGGLRGPAGPTGFSIRPVDGSRA